jgi:hypothetical protein
MKLIAFNGSPGKGWNTATMLKHAMEGAAAAGAETEIIHLYDLQIQGLQKLLRLQDERRQELWQMLDEGRFGENPAEKRAVSRGFPESLRLGARLVAR